MTDAPDDGTGRRDAAPDNTAWNDAAPDAAAADGLPSHAVVDLDGTVYRGDEPIAGVAEALDRLRDAGIGVTFLTNNATMDRERYRDRLRGLGVWRDGDGLVTAASVTAHHLAATRSEPALHVLGSDGLRRELRDAGLAPGAAPGDADALVVSMDRGVGYDDLHDALRASREVGDGGFVATNRDPTCPTPTGERPGTGAIVAAVAAAAEREPDVVCGKPGDAMVDQLRERLDDPASALVVGDRVGTDVATGHALGARTALVLTGATTRDDLHAIADGDDGEDVRPGRVADSLAALVDELLA